MTRGYRSVTWGTCCLGGQHRDARMQRECPALRQKRASASSRPAEASRMRQAIKEKPASSAS